MPLTDGERDTLNAMDDHGLAEMWLTYEAAQVRAKTGRDYVEYLMLRRMQERGAKALSSPTLDIALTRPYDVDLNALMPLKELMDPALVVSGFTPPEQVWTEEKANMTVINSWRKFGDEHERIIEGAKVYGPERIRIKRKAVKA